MKKTISSQKLGSVKALAMFLFVLLHYNSAVKSVLKIVTVAARSLLVSSPFKKSLSSGGRVSVLLLPS